VRTIAVSDSSSCFSFRSIREWRHSFSFITNMLLRNRTRSPASILSLLFFMAVTFGSCAQRATAQTPQFLLDNAPRLGDSVKQFKRAFPSAHCRRQSSGEVDAHAIKREWNRWIDCAVEKGVFAYGQPVATSQDDQISAAVSAIFRDQKLVSLEFVYDARYLDALLRSFVLRYGPPDPFVRPPAGETTYVCWTHGHSRLEIQRLAIHGRADGPGAFRIEKNATATGVRVRLSLITPELYGELQGQDNAVDLTESH
jgi:hypothetical protein